MPRFHASVLRRNGCRRGGARCLFRTLQYRLLNQSEQHQRHFQLFPKFQWRLLSSYHSCGPFLYPDSYSKASIVEYQPNPKKVNPLPPLPIGPYPNLTQAATLKVVPVIQNSLPPLAYYVHRTASQQLPIYHLAKRGGNLRQTRIRKIDGNLMELKKDLRHALGLKEEQIAINSLTKHIIIKVRFGPVYHLPEAVTDWRTFPGLEKSRRHEVLDGKKFLIDWILVYIPSSAAQEVVICYNKTFLYKCPKIGRCPSQCRVRLLPFPVPQAKRSSDVHVRNVGT